MHVTYTQMPSVSQAPVIPAVGAQEFGKVYGFSEIGIQMDHYTRTQRGHMMEMSVFRPERVTVDQHNSGGVPCLFIQIVSEDSHIAEFRIFGMTRANFIQAMFPDE